MWDYIFEKFSVKLPTLTFSSHNELKLGKKRNLKSVFGRFLHDYLKALNQHLLWGFSLLVLSPKITIFSVFWCILLRSLSVINQRHIEQEESINRPLDSSSKSHNSHNVQRSGFWGFQNGSSESCKIPNFSPLLCGAFPTYLHSWKRCFWHFDSPSTTTTPIKRGFYHF